MVLWHLDGLFLGLQEWPEFKPGHRYQGVFEEVVKKMFSVLVF